MLKKILAELAVTDSVTDDDAVTDSAEGDAVSDGQRHVHAYTCLRVDVT